MSKSEKVQLNLYVNKEVRTKLHLIAAQRIFENPEKHYSAARVGAEFLTEYLSSLKEDQKS
jgi:hypothetical protein